MISLVVCSRTPKLTVELEENVAKTIGIEYEWVVIDNSRNKYSIFEAYNEGVSRSKGEILCFMHDDILYHTNAWGKSVTKWFSDTTIGLVGVAGTHFLPSVPTYWFNSPFISEYNLTNDNGQIIRCIKEDYFLDNNLVNAVAVDGLCFYVKRELFEYIKFDEGAFSGFHMYDMDICMQVLQKKYRVCVSRDVLIEHNFSFSYPYSGLEDFYNAQHIFLKKWKEHLPISRGIDNIPNFTLDRVNNLFKELKAAKSIKNSKKYKLGKFILTPISFIRKITK